MGGGSNKSFTRQKNKAVNWYCLQPPFGKASPIQCDKKLPLQLTRQMFNMAFVLTRCARRTTSLQGLPHKSQTNFHP